MFVNLCYVQQAAAQTCMITGEDLFCSIGTYNYTADVSGVLNPSYQWTIDGGGTIVAGQDAMQVVVDWTSAGVHTLTCEISENGSVVAVCELEINAAVVSFDQLLQVPTIRPRNVQDPLRIPLLCVGSAFEVTLSSSLPEEATTIWTYTGGAVTGDSEGAIITPHSAGLGQLCIEVLLDGNTCYTSCEAIEAVDLTIPPVITTNPPHDGGTLEVCRDQVIRFSSDYPFDRLIWRLTYEWQEYSFFGSSFSFDFGAMGAYSVEVEALVDAPCVGAKSLLTVDVSEKPGIQILCPEPICSDDNVYYEASGDCADYIWSIENGTGDIVSEDGNGVYVTWHNDAGLLYGELTVQGVGCDDLCDLPSTTLVPLFPPAAMIEGANGLCAGGSGRYGLPSWPGVQYSWSVDRTDLVDLSTLGSSAVLRPKSGATGEVVLSVQVSQQGLADCVFEDMITVTIYDDQIEDAGPFCSYDEIRLRLVQNNGMAVDWIIQDEAGNTIYQEEMVTGDLIIPAHTLDGGSYTVMAILPGGLPDGCPVDTRIEVIPQPEAPQVEGPRDVCPGSVHTYVTSSMGDIDWIVSGGTILSGDGSSVVEVQWDGAQTDNMIQVTATVDGCVSNPSIVIITEQEEPMLNILGSTEVCPDNLDPITYMASFDGASSYHWSVVPAHLGSIVSGQGTAEIGVLWHYVDIATEVILQLNVDYCDQQTQMVHHITINPTVATLVVNSPICAGSTVTLTATPNSALAYRWLVDGVLVGITDVPTFNHRFVGEGAHEVEVIVQNGEGCFGEISALAMVDVLANPRPNIFLDAPLPCPADVFSRVLSVTQGVQGGSYQWYADGVQIPGATAPTLSVTEGDVGTTYRIEVDYGNGCTNADTYTLDYDCPVDGDGCEDCEPEVELDIFNVHVSIGECGAVLVEGRVDQFDDPQIAGVRYIRRQENGGSEIILVPLQSELRQTWTYTEPGIYPIRLEVDWICEDGDICTVADEDVIRIPLIVEQSLDFGCFLNGILYRLELQNRSRSIEGITSSTWTVDGEGVFGTPLLNLGVTYEVCLEVETASGYSCEECEMITAPSAPSGSFSVDKGAFCEGELVTLRPLGILLEDIVDITWDFGDGSISKQPMPQKVYAIGTANQTFNITLSYETIYGCNVTRTTSITVHENNLGGEIQFEYDNCQSSATLSFIPMPITPNIVSYQWNPINDDSEEVTVMESGLYSIEVTDDHGCSFNTSEVINLNEVMIGEIFGPRDACRGLDLRVFNDQATDVTWTVTGPESFTDDGPRLNRSGLPSGTYSVLVTISKDGVDCQTQEVQVTIHGTPAAAVITQEVLACDPTLVRLVADQEVSWFGPGSGLARGTPPLTTLTVSQNGTYEAYIVTEHGCESLASIDVQNMIDFTSLPGSCTEVCLEDLLADTEVISGIPGSFDSWAWEVDGMIRSEGSGAVMDLLLKEGDQNVPIRLIVNDGDCETASSSFFIDAVPCNLMCEEIELNSGVNYSLCQIGGGFNQLAIDVALFVSLDKLPDGYFDCGFDPVMQNVITSGSFSDTWDRNLNANTLNYSGVIIIEDPDEFQMNGGIHADWIVCNEAGQECPVALFFPFQMGTLNMCEDGDQLMCPNIRMCNTGYTIDRERNTRSERICMTLPFIQGPECDISSYTITVRPLIDGVLGAAIHTELVTASTLPSVVEICETITLSLDLLEKLDGLVFEIESDCAGSCSLLYPIGQIKSGWCQTNLTYSFEGKKVGHSPDNMSYTGIQLHPNPTTSYVTVHLDRAYDVLELYASNGRLMERKNIRSKVTEFSLNMEDYTPGLYLIRVISNDHASTKVLEVIK